MTNQARIYNVLIASALAVVSVYAVKNLGLVLSICGGVCAESALSLFVYGAFTVLLSAVPATVFLWFRKVEHCILIGLSGVLGAWAVAFAIIPLFTHTTLWLFNLVSYLIAIPCFVTADALYNRLRWPLPWKLIVAGLFIVVLPIISYLIVRLA